MSLYTTFSMLGQKNADCHYIQFSVLGQGNAECHYIQSLVCWDGGMQNVIIYRV